MNDIEPVQSESFFRQRDPMRQYLFSIDYKIPKEEGLDLSPLGKYGLCVVIPFSKDTGDLSITYMLDYSVDIDNLLSLWMNTLVAPKYVVGQITVFLPDMRPYKVYEVKNMIPVILKPLVYDWSSSGFVTREVIFSYDSIHSI